MDDIVSDLDQLQSAYKAAVEQWIAAIKQEETLASANHTVAEIDKWEQAHFRLFPGTYLVLLLQLY